MKLNDLSLEKNVKYNETLNPKIWDGMDLKKEIRQKLIEIGEKFFEFLEAPEKALVDFYLVGSCANYNWSKFSDIDLHVVMDYHAVGETCNEEIVEDFLFAKRAVWLDKYDITVNGMQVEVGPQSKDVELESAAVYSLLENQWIKKPKMVEPKIDESRYEKMADAMRAKIDKLLAKKHPSSTEVQKLRDELKDMRKKGLAKGGEFNADNLVYKSLRNQGYLDKLDKLANDATSEELSL